MKTPSDVARELQDLYKKIDSRQASRLSEEEIVDIVKAHRKKGQRS